MKTESLSPETLVEMKFLRLEVHVFEETEIASYTSMVLNYSPAPPESLIKISGCIKMGFTISVGRFSHRPERINLGSPFSG